MKVEQVMTRNVECIRPDATLQQAARRMKELDVGPLPVCGEGDRLVGIVTDRDIAVRAVAGGLDPSQTRVHEVMTPGIRYCFADDDIQDALRLMQEHQIRRVVALDRSKRLVGIVSIGDVAVDVRDEALVGSTLEAISESR